MGCKHVFLKGKQLNNNNSKHEGIPADADYLAHHGGSTHEIHPPPKRAGKDLTKGAVSSVLFVFSLPIVLHMSIQPVYGVIDRIFIGQISADAFNAVVNAGMIQTLVIILAAGLASGVTSYIARLVGAGDLAEADNAAKHSMIVMLALSITVLVLFYFFDIQFFKLLGVEPHLMARARGYARIIVLGNIAVMFMLVGSNVLRGEGDSVTPLKISIFSVVANLVLDPPLIFGRHDKLFGLSVGWFGLDVEGGALATIISRAAGCGLLIWYVLRGKSNWTLSLKNFHWYPRHIVEILRVGFPMLLLNLSSWVASMVFLRLLNSYPAGVEAYGIGIQLTNLATLPMIGLMLGVVTMVGQSYGAGDLDRARRATIVGGIYAIIFSVALALIYLQFHEFIIHLFNKDGDPEVRKLGFNFIYIVSFTFMFVAQVYVLGGAFEGLGKGMPPLIITIIRFTLIAIPLGLILTPKMGPVGVWIAIAISQVLGGVIAVVWIIIEFRKRKKAL